MIKIKKFPLEIPDFNSFYNRPFDKSRLKALISWSVFSYGGKRTIDLVEKLKTLGYAYATKAGISLSIDDLKIPPSKKQAIRKAEQVLNFSKQEVKKGQLTTIEYFSKVIETWTKTSENLKDDVIEHFKTTDELNPVFLMAFSGARGNISQVRQLTSMRGLMADPQGRIINFPIQSNFREGLTLTEYLISCYGARKGVVDTALRTATSGYLTRRLVDVAHHVIVQGLNCHTRQGFELKSLKKGTKVILSLKNRLLGRRLAEDIYDSKKELIATRNQEISTSLSLLISKTKTSVLVRSPLTCQDPKYVCQLCYGWSLANHRLVSSGEAIGILAAQSIGEPGTQLTMRTFHTGGVFSGEVSDEIKAPFSGVVSFNQSIPGQLIRTTYGQIVFLTKQDSSLTLTVKTSFSSRESREVHLKLPAYTLLFVKQNQRVVENQVLGEVSTFGNEQNQSIESDQTIYSELSGQVKFQRSKGILIDQNQIKHLIGPEGVKDPLRKKMRQFKTVVNGRTSSTSGEFWILSAQKQAILNPINLLVRPGDFVHPNSSIYLYKLLTDGPTQSGTYRANTQEFPKKKTFPLYDFGKTCAVKAKNQKDRFLNFIILNEKLTLRKGNRFLKSSLEPRILNGHSDQTSIRSLHPLSNQSQNYLPQTFTEGKSKEDWTLCNSLKGFSLRERSKNRFPEGKSPFRNGNHGFLNSKSTFTKIPQSAFFKTQLRKNDGQTLSAPKLCLSTKQKSCKQIGFSPLFKTQTGGFSIQESLLTTFNSKLKGWVSTFRLKQPDSAKIVQRPLRSRPFQLLNSHYFNPFHRSTTGTKSPYEVPLPDRTQIISRKTTSKKKRSGDLSPEDYFRTSTLTASRKETSRNSPAFSAYIMNKGCEKPPFALSTDKVYKMYAHQQSESKKFGSLVRPLALKVHVEIGSWKLFPLLLPSVKGTSYPVRSFTLGKSNPQTFTEGKTSTGLRILSFQTRKRFNSSLYFFNKIVPTGGPLSKLPKQSPGPFFSNSASAFVQELPKSLKQQFLFDSSLQNSMNFQNRLFWFAQNQEFLNSTSEVEFQKTGPNKLRSSEEVFSPINEFKETTTRSSFVARQSLNRRGFFKEKITFTFGKRDFVRSEKVSWGILQKTFTFGKRNSVRVEKAADSTAYPWSSEGSFVNKQKLKKNRLLPSVKGTSYKKQSCPLLQKPFYLRNSLNFELLSQFATFGRSQQICRQTKFYLKTFLKTYTPKFEGGSLLPSVKGTSYRSRSLFIDTELNSKGRKGPSAASSLPKKESSLNSNLRPTWGGQPGRIFKSDLRFLIVEYQLLRNSKKIATTLLLKVKPTILKYSTSLNSLLKSAYFLNRGALKKDLLLNRLARTLKSTQDLEAKQALYEVPFTEGKSRSSQTLRKVKKTSQSYSNSVVLRNLDKANPKLASLTSSFFRGLTESNFWLLRFLKTDEIQTFGNFFLNFVSWSTLREERRPNKLGISKVWGNPQKLATKQYDQGKQPRNLGFLTLGLPDQFHYYQHSIPPIQAQIRTRIVKTILAQRNSKPVLSAEQGHVDQSQSDFLWENPCTKFLLPKVKVLISYQQDSEFLESVFKNNKFHFVFLSNFLINIKSPTKRNFVRKPTSASSYEVPFTESQSNPQTFTEGKSNPPGTILSGTILSVGTTRVGQWQKNLSLLSYIEIRSSNSYEVPFTEGKSFSWSPYSSSEQAKLKNFQLKIGNLNIFNLVETIFGSKQVKTNFQTPKIRYEYKPHLNKPLTDRVAQKKDFVFLQKKPIFRSELQSVVQTGARSLVNSTFTKLPNLSEENSLGRKTRDFSLDVQERVGSSSSFLLTTYPGWIFAIRNPPKKIQRHKSFNVAGNLSLNDISFGNYFTLTKFLPIRFGKDVFELQAGGKVDFWLKTLKTFQFHFLKKSNLSCKSSSFLSRIRLKGSLLVSRQLSRPSTLSIRKLRELSSSGRLDAARISTKPGFDSGSVERDLVPLRQGFRLFREKGFDSPLPKSKISWKLKLDERPSLNQRLKFDQEMSIIGNKFIYFNEALVRGYLPDQKYCQNLFIIHPSSVWKQGFERSVLNFLRGQRFFCRSKDYDPTSRLVDGVHHLAKSFQVKQYDPDQTLSLNSGFESLYTYEVPFTEGQSGERLSSFHKIKILKTFLVFYSTRFQLVSGKALPLASDLGLCRSPLLCFRRKQSWLSVYEQICFPRKQSKSSESFDGCDNPSSYEVPFTEGKSWSIPDDQGKVTVKNKVRPYRFSGVEACPKRGIQILLDTPSLAFGGELTVNCLPLSLLLPKVKGTSDPVRSFTLGNLLKAKKTRSSDKSVQPSGWNNLSELQSVVQTAGTTDAKSFGLRQKNGNIQVINNYSRLSGFKNGNLPVFSSRTKFLLPKVKVFDSAGQPSSLSNRALRLADPGSNRPTLLKDTEVFFNRTSRFKPKLLILGRLTSIRKSIESKKTSVFSVNQKTVGLEKRRVFDFLTSSTQVLFSAQKSTQYRTETSKSVQKTTFSLLDKTNLLKQSQFDLVSWTPALNAKPGASRSLRAQMIFRKNSLRLKLNALCLSTEERPTPQELLMGNLNLTLLKQFISPSFLKLEMQPQLQISWTFFNALVSKGDEEGQFLKTAFAKPKTKPEPPKTPRLGGLTGSQKRQKSRGYEIVRTNAKEKRKKARKISEIPRQKNGFHLFHIKWLNRTWPSDGLRVLEKPIQFGLRKLQGLNYSLVDNGFFIKQKLRLRRKTPFVVYIPNNDKKDKKARQERLSNLSIGKPSTFKSYCRMNRLEVFIQKPFASKFDLVDSQESRSKFNFVEPSGWNNLSELRSGWNKTIFAESNKSKLFASQRRYNYFSEGKNSTYEVPFTEGKSKGQRAKRRCALDTLFGQSALRGREQTTFGLFSGQTAGRQSWTAAARGPGNRFDNFSKVNSLIKDWSSYLEYKFKNPLVLNSGLRSGSISTSSNYQKLLVPRPNQTALKPSRNSFGFPGGKKVQISRALLSPRFGTEIWSGSSKQVKFLNYTKPVHLVQFHFTILNQIDPYEVPFTEGQSNPPGTFSLAGSNSRSLKNEFFQKGLQTTSHQLLKIKDQPSKMIGFKLTSTFNQCGIESFIETIDKNYSTLKNGQSLLKGEVFHASRSRSLKLVDLLPDKKSSPELQLLTNSDLVTFQIKKSKPFTPLLLPKVKGTSYPVQSFTLSKSNPPGTILSVGTTLRYEASSLPEEDSSFTKVESLSSKTKEDKLLPSVKGTSYGTTTQQPDPFKVDIGQLVRYGKEISLNVGLTESGQVLLLQSNKMVLRYAKPFLLASGGNCDLAHGDFVNRQSPLLTLKYKTLKTEDIVQGIPKIEQLFEARGNPLEETGVNTLLKKQFQTYKTIYPKVIAARKSIEFIQHYIIDGIQNVYQSQGVNISDKHIEIIVKQMTSKVKVLIPGTSSGLLRGDITDFASLQKMEKSVTLCVEEAKPTEFEPIVLGITKAALDREGFLSAASFQETIKILTKTTLLRREDYLRGLKENVILGLLIPAGTGSVVEAILDRKGTILKKRESALKRKLRPREFKNPGKKPKAINETLFVETKQGPGPKKTPWVPKILKKRLKKLLKTPEGIN
jgi:hypothetical protein